MITTREFFEELETQFKNQLPFVAYKDPSAKTPFVKSFLQKDEQVHTIQDFSESGFVFAPFDNQQKAILIPAEDSIKLQLSFEDSEEIANSGKITESAEDTAAKENHKTIVGKAIENIKEGRLKKVVLSRKEESKIQDLDVLKVFKDLLQKYPTAFVYIWYHPKIGLWLGATPETLLKVERGRFSTMALAGTQKYLEDVKVSWGEKEREEQQIVVDSILESLGNASAENIKISEAFTSKAGNLLHLRTDISGEIVNENLSLKALIENLHPTPAVCGLPGGTAKAFILKHENYDREFYTGYLGELNLKKQVKRSSNRRNQENQAYGAVSTSSALFVNLRCMKIEKDQAVIFIGGGITKDSDPEAEWAETTNKAGTMKAVLG